MFTFIINQQTLSKMPLYKMEINYFHVDGIINGIILLIACKHLANIPPQVVTVQIFTGA